jgi:hypothetical protein
MQPSLIYTSFDGADHANAICTRLYHPPDPLSTRSASTDIQTVSRPLTIATTYKADKFDNCTMTRSAADLGINFVRTQDGLLLLRLTEMEA